MAILIVSIVGTLSVHTQGKSLGQNRNQTMLMAAGSWEVCVLAKSVFLI